MQKISRTMFFVCLLISISMPVMATPVISVSGFADEPYLTDPSQVLAAGWSQAAAFSNVSISIDFEDDTFGDLPGVYSAYLMNQIGAGTTNANELAFTTFNAGANLSTILLWSGLLLDPGNYFLVIALDPNLNSAVQPEGTWWATSDVPSVFTAPGVTDGGQYFSSNIEPTYLPASTFTSDTSQRGRLLYDVQSVPEPSTMLLMTLGSVLGLAALGFRRS